MLKIVRKMSGPPEAARKQAVSLSSPNDAVVGRICHFSNSQTVFPKVGQVI